MTMNRDISIHDIDITDQLEPVGGCCEGCGSTETIEQIRAKHPGAMSCCPERVMVSAKTWRARAIAGVDMVVSQLEAICALKIVKIDDEGKIRGLEIQIETMTSLARAREGNLKRACEGRDEAPRLLGVVSIAFDVMSARCFDAEAKLEACARLIEDNQICDTSEGQMLQPRMDGNRAGLAYAVAIRALTAKEDGSNGR